MNVHHIRAALRWVAGTATAAALGGMADGLIRPDPFENADIWRALIAWLLILGTWLLVEVITGCTDRVIAAQPKAHHIVTETLREVERQAARESGLPQIVGGERLR